MILYYPIGKAKIARSGTDVTIVFIWHWDELRDASGRGTARNGRIS